MIKHIYVTVILCLALASCEKLGGHYDGRLQVINKTDIDVVSFLNTNFPDTTMGLLGGCISCIHEIPANSTSKMSNPQNWEKYIQDRNEMDILTVFIVERDTFIKYGTPELQNSMYFLERYDFSIEELKSSDWKVIHE